MTGVRYDDLPPAMRAQVDAALGPQAAKRTTRRQLRSQGSPGACGCGERFDRYETWEKHADSAGHGHRRFLLDVEATP